MGALLSLMGIQEKNEDFQRLLGLDIFSLRDVEDEKLNLDYIFRKYGCFKSYFEYRNEFVVPVDSGYTCGLGFSCWNSWEP